MASDQKGQDELPLPDGERRARAEEQIKSNARVVDYSIREYPIEVIVSKYLDGEADGTNEIFIPDYQRNFVWPQRHQSRFIESVLIGLPIPYLFAADVSFEDDELSGRLEIVDGTQRLRTLAAFINGELRLSDLQKLTYLNGCKLGDLLSSRQRRFGRTTIRLIELTEKADEETRRDMFDRINSGGVSLNPMETRRGVRSGPFLTFVSKLANGTEFRELAPLSEASIKRRDYDELVIRFFAYMQGYQQFERSVIDFINDYLDGIADGFDDNLATDMCSEWERMLSFVSAKFKYGFRKGATNNRTPRVRFEAIAVGVALALRQNPSCDPSPEEVAGWAYSREFHELVSSDGANSRPRIMARINYVRNKILGEP